eukprot:CAMPEP_0172421018 /NCGR_PEP_ID=MMETSP1064-20121228/7305_1 /TAXON_ID=202472 /ORGANISM="Aulacoseira subarctica , Strain CCAP 1002/5" /LENGTH=390 /DNA_ID=CAMNT_0013161213 /DNA_START=695 /DNA_END=1864 /DNA_ORIENTATION=-
MLLEGQDNIARHVSNLVEVKEKSQTEFSTAKFQRKETYKLIQEAKKHAIPLPKEELQALQVQYDQMRIKANVANEKKKKVNNKEIDFYATLVKDLNDFIKLKQGPMERSLEWVISNHPISAKHNPYFGGSFNGNDCNRLLENVQSIFNALLEAAELLDPEARDSAKISLEKHFDIWDAFARIASLLRSTRKLTPEQQKDLLEDTKNFVSVYTAKSKESIICKMHLLFAHLEKQLSTYGTIGFWSEDSNEAAHAAVNRLDRVFASLDKTRKTLSILCSLKEAAKRSLVKQSTKQEKKYKTGKESKRKQGASQTSCDFPFDDELAKLASSATELLRNRDWDAEDSHPASHLEYNEEFCKHCRDYLALDEKISAQLAELHFLVKHAHNDAKSS